MDNTITSNVVARPSSATSSATAGSSRAGTAGSAQDINDRFLTLLITQMKNQDPLSPMDNSQLTSQLSQISTVSGIENLNTTMKSLAAQFAGLQTMQATSLAGRDVMIAGNRIAVGEDGVGRAALRLADGADQLRVVVKDAGGNVVRSLELGRTDAGVRNFEWDGRNDNGGAVAKGDYSFTAQALKAGQATDVETLARMRVEGVLQTDTGARLNFGAAGTRSVGDVIEIL